MDQLELVEVEMNEFFSFNLEASKRKCPTSSYALGQ